MRQIIETTANPFQGKLPIEVFVETEMRVARGSKEPWHQFYVVDLNQQQLTIVSSFRIMYKRGNQDNFNLLIENVHTNPEYRKQGFVGYLISECIKKYEIPGHKFEATNSDNEDADAYIAQYVRPNTYNYYWTLYSGISEFYAKFGFKSVPEMDWLVYEEPVMDKTLAPAFDLESYPDGRTQVTLLKTDSDLPGHQPILFRSGVRFVRECRQITIDPKHKSTALDGPQLLYSRRGSELLLRAKL